MTLRYFGTVSGEVVRFNRVDNRNRAIKHDDCWGWHETTRQWIKIDRVIDYKPANAPKHEYDDRCMNATGRTMKCECACGGKNHGRSAFNCS